jgi:chromosome segregation ATPase
MGFMQKAVYRRSLRFHGIVAHTRSFSFFLFFSAFICGTAVPAFSGKLPAVQPRMSLDEATNRMAGLQKRADSLTAVRDQLRQDSVKASAESGQQTSALSKKLSEADDGIAKKKSVMAGIKTRYDKSLQDSIQIVAKAKEQIAGVQKEIARLDAAIITVSNDLAALTERREKTGTSRGGLDERAIAQQQSQTVHSDTVIRQRQADLSNLGARRDKLRQDSLAAETKRLGDRAALRQQLRQLDSQTVLCDAAIGQAEQKQAKERGEKEQKIARMKESYGLMARQKQGFDEKITRTNTDVSVYMSERQRLVQSAGAAQTKYEQLRAPLDKALADAETSVQRFTKDKPLLMTLRQKLRIDSAIAKTRDLLDKAIQMEAERKKGGKKLVERRESELDSLLLVQDMVVRSTPGLRQKEQQIHGATVSQKCALTDSALAGIDRKIALAQAQLDKAKQNIGDFDRKTPPVKNPAGQRIAQLDTMVTAKKKDVIQMTDWIDSLNMTMQELQTNITAGAAALQTGPAKTDTTGQARKAEKTALAGKRVKLQRDSIQVETAAAETMLRIKNDAAALATQSAKTQNEIDRAAAEREKAKQSIAALLEKDKQLQNSTLAEKNKFDSLIAVKQQEVSAVSAQSDKLRQDSASLVKKLEQQVKNLSPAPGSLAATLSDASKELGALQTQSDSLRRLVSAGGQGRMSDNVRKIAQQLASVNASIDGVRNDMATLNAQKEEAFSVLNADKRYYDSLVGVADKELTAIVAKRDKARLDSSAAEYSIRQTSQKFSSALAQRDNLVATREKELADATAEYNRARDDSVKIVYKNMGSVQPGSQTLRSIDALLTVKEKELADLRTRLQKTGQDSIAESKRQADLLIAAHNEIKKRMADMEQRKAELELAMAVKNEPQKDGDVTLRNYRELLTAATAMINEQNKIINKKKNDIARLQSVRDAINSAAINAPKDDGMSRLEDDKRHYDSLINIAQKELAAAITQRDKSQEDSTTLADNERKFSQKMDTRLAVHDSMVAGRQREVDDAAAECSRARDDSAKTAGQIAAALQPYRQTAKSIEVIITTKGKEVADLRARREKASQDGAQENKRQAGDLAAAHSDIVKQSAIVEQKKADLAAAVAAKTDAQKDTATALRPFRDALAAAYKELNNQNGSLEDKKADIARLQTVRDAISAKMKAGGKSAAAVISPAEIAQKRSEEIYTLIGENKIAAASKLFKQYQASLKANLDNDSYQAIKMTIEQMGGSTR